MDELIKRLETAPGPDAALDAAIEALVNGGTSLSPPRYTASLDAALMLVPASPPHDWDVFCENDPLGAARFIAHCHKAELYGAHSYEPSFGATPALALCVAALTALGALVGGQSNRWPF
jgi:hypothetical protein